MAGVLITEKCNLKCPYCFAQDRMTDSNCITLEQYHDILQYALNSGEDELKLVGGEPTIHPHFDEIIKMSNAWARSTGGNYIVFTNGILIRRFMPFINFDYGAVLVNYNSTRYTGEHATQEIYAFLDDARKKGLLDIGKVSVGFNVFVGQKEQDFESVYSLIRHYGLKIIRVSTATPPYEIGRDDFFTKIKASFICFLKTCEKLGIKNFLFDCNVVPYCYFTNEELEYLKTLNYPFAPCCSDPVLDISGNMTATCCLGAGCKERVSLNDFDDLTAVRRYFQATYIFPMLNNLPQKCKECRLGKTYQCFGGCLRFLNSD